MNRKFSLLITLIISFIVAGAVAAQEAKPRIWLGFSAEQLAVGEEATVTVNISGAVGIYGTSFQLSYDATALEVVAVDSQAVTPGTFWGDAPSFPLTNRAEAGTVTYALTLVQPAEPLSGDGVLGTVTFRALSDTPVVVTTGEASLVAPQFAEVDGRKVAQRMDTIVPEGAGMAASQPVAGITENQSQAQNLASAQPEVVPAATTGVASVSVAAALAARQSGSSAGTAPEIVGVAPDSAPGGGVSSSFSPTLIFAGVLFLFGIFLLLVSVGLYTRMRGVNWVRE